MGKGKGERENIPRVKALIITLNPAERKKNLSVAFYSFACPLHPLLLWNVRVSLPACVNKHVLTDGKLKIAFPVC